MTTLELLNYYSGLLIFQYNLKPKAIGLVQTVVNGIIMAQTSVQDLTFNSVPDSGTFVLSYNGNSTAALNWDDDVTVIEAALQALPGLNLCTVSGSIADQLLTVTFTGVTPPALSLLVEANSLKNVDLLDVDIDVLETDLSLPLAVQSGFNLLGANTAQGVQLDIIGKYAGVTRNGSSTSGAPITLDDTDFLTFIKMAIVTNSAGSSLADITGLLFQFFQGQIFVVDSTQMRLTYLISSLVSNDLLQLFITERLLPAPMGVGVSVIIYAPIVNAFFGFVNYDNPAQPAVTRPFNTYDDYQTDWPWFSYSNVLPI